MELETMPLRALGPAMLLELQLLEEQVGGLVESLDIGASQAIGEAESGEGEAFRRDSWRRVVKPVLFWL